MMRDIPGYDGRYKINECGNVINNKKHMMRSAVSNSGYLRVALEHPDGHRYNESIHRLVAKTFLPNPNNLPVVMHLDNDRLNNHISNLRWGTYQENRQQAIADGLYQKRLIRILNPRFYRYKLYNDNGDSLICNSRSDLAETIGYAEISLKNMVGNDRIITQGLYKGYKIEKVKGTYTNINDYI